MADSILTPTRERLLSTALRLFWEKGYNSTSVADILREAEANSGSLYHFFPTKQDVLVGVLEEYRNGIEPMLLEPVWDGVEDPIERVFALLHGYRRLLLESDFRLGCPIGNIALEIAEPDPVVRERLVENFEGWVAAVKGCFDEAESRLPLGVNTTDLARFCLVNMEGGVMLARSYRDIEPFDAMVATLRDYFRLLGVAGVDLQSHPQPQGGQS
ncbi:MAG: TetR/AcrR family transcriptional regulator [Gemmatimonadota bacterium]